MTRRSNPLGPTGSDLRALRVAARLRQRDLAELAGVARETVNRWERGRNCMPYSAFKLIELLVGLKAARDSAAIGDLVRRHALRAARLERNREKRRARGRGA